MYCTRCGALIEEKSPVCRECGELFGDVELKKQSELKKFSQLTDDESSKK